MTPADLAALLYAMAGSVPEWRAWGELALAAIVLGCLWIAATALEGR